MPTLPPPPAGDPHRQHEMARSFGQDAERYDRARPSYPDAMVRRILAAGPGRDVLDVGCGTGISSRLFQAAGCRVSGVDPDERMAEIARRAGIEVDVSAFETWDPAGRTFDLIIAGQSWHWIDPVAGAAAARRALRDGGRLALFWNVYQPVEEVRAALAGVYARLAPRYPMFGPAMSVAQPYDTMFGTAENGIRKAGGFAEPERWTFHWEQPYTKQQWLDVVPTQGLHTRMDPETLQGILTATGAVVDELGGCFTMKYTTGVVTTTA